MIMSKTPSAIAALPSSPPPPIVGTRVYAILFLVPAFIRRQPVSSVLVKPRQIPLARRVLPYPTSTSLSQEWCVTQQAIPPELYEMQL